MEPDKYYNQSLLNKAMTDKWQAVIPVPDILSDVDMKRYTNDPNMNYSVNSNSFLWSLEKANTPKIRIPSKDVPYSGQTMKISSQTRKDLEDLEFEFKIDNRFTNYLYIYRWLNVLHDELEGTYDANNITPNNYKLDSKDGKILRMLKYYSVDMTITHLDEYEKPIVNFNYIGVFPTSLSGIRQSYQDPTKISCTATFAYSQFSIVPAQDIQGITLPIVSSVTSTTVTPTESSSTTTATTTIGDANNLC